MSAPETTPEAAKPITVRLRDWSDRQAQLANGEDMLIPLAREAADLIEALTGLHESAHRRAAKAESDAWVARDALDKSAADAVAKEER